MSTCLPEDMDVHASHNQITELWKTKTGSSPRVENHRLKCCSSIQDPASNPADGMKTDSRIYRSEEDAIEVGTGNEGLVGFLYDLVMKMFTNSFSQMIQLLENHKRLEKQMKRSQIFQVITILALIVLITVQIYINYDEIFVTDSSSSKSSEL